MDIIRLLDELGKLIDDTPNFGPVTWGLNRDEISMQISKIRASLPQELKAAVSTVRESDRILEQAREDATGTLDNARREVERIQVEARQEAQRIIDQARLQQEQMIVDHEVYKIAKAQAEEIRNAADRDATQLRRGADKYAYDVLSQIEGVVGKVMTTLERGKQDLEPSVQPNPALPREKVRV